MKVLLVDDNPRLREMLGDILKMKGIESVPIETGAEALARIERQDIDVALIDLKLEDMSGLDVLRGIKQRSSNTECILLTGNASQASAIQAVNLGAYAYFQKPYDVEQLLVAIRRATEKREAEEALKKSEKRFRALIENSAEMIIVINETGAIQFASPSVEPIMGYKPEDAIGRNFLEWVHPEDLPLAMEALDSRSKIPGTAPNSMIVRGRHKDGIWRFMEVLGTNLLAEDAVRGIVLNVRDVTERRRAEDALHQSDARYRDLVENSRDLICAHDLQGNLLFVNEAGTKISGYSNETLLKMNLRDILAPEVRDRFDAYLAELQAKGQAHGLMRVQTSAGEIRYLEFKNTLQTESLAAPIARGTARDVTEQLRAKEALQNSEKRFRALIENGRDNISMLAADGTLLWESPSTISTLGYAPNQFVGRNIFELMHPDDQGWTRDLFAQILQTPGRTQDGIFRLQHSDGTWRWVESTTTNMLAEPGVQAIIINYRDITERKQAEVALQESEKKYQVLTEISPVGVFKTDAQGSTTYVNPRWCQISGLSAEEALGDGWLCAVHPQDREKLSEGWKQAARAQVSSISEYRFVRPDGSITWVMGQSTPERNIEDQVVGYVGTITDITERKQAEEKLHLQSAALEASANAIVITNHEGLIQWANPAFNALTGYQSSNEVYGYHPRDLIKSGKQDQKFYKNLWDTILAGKVWHGELVNRRKDGTLYNEEMTITPLKDDSGQIRHFIAVKQNITERKQAEKELRALSTRQEAILSAVPDILMEVDQDKMYTWANPAGFEFFGEDVIGKEAAIYFDGEQDTYDVVKPLFNGGEDVIYVESWQRRRDGEKRLLAWWCRALMDTNGNVVGTLSSAHDITERKQAEEEIRRRAEELAALYESSQALAGKISLDDVLQTTTRSALRLFNAAGVSLYLYDPSARMLEVKMTTHPAIPIGTRLSLGEGLAGKVAQTRQAMRIDNYMAWEGRSSKYEGIPIHATLETPMVYQDELIGVLVAHEAGDSERKFTEADERLISLFAAPAAAAIQNARLFEDLRLRLAEMETLQAVASACMAAEDEDTLLTRITGLISETLYPDNFGFVMMGENGAALLPHPSYRGVTLEGIPAQISLEGSIAGRAAASGQPYRTGDARKEEVYLEINPATRSEICVPMLAGERVLGVINAESHQVERFSAQDERLLTILAGQAATAIEHLRAQAGERQHLAELELLYQSGLALGQLLSPQEIGQKIIELLMQKLDWDHTTIRAYHPQDETLELLAFNQSAVKGEMERREAQERFQTLISRSGQGMSGWVVQNHQIVRSGDIGGDPRYVETEAGIHSGLYVPIKSGQRVIGVISIESEQPNAFSEADERLVSTLAAQAASALENARLFEETRQRVKELETLNRVSVALRAVSKQEAMLAVVLEETLSALNASDGSINLLNNATGKLRQTMARGWPSEFSEAPIQPGEGIFGSVFVSGNTYISRDFASDPLTRPEASGQLPAGWGGACIPIRSTEQTLGVMLIAIPGGREFSKEQVRLLNTLAEMTGNALQRASLYEETFRRLRHLESLRVVDRAIAAGSLDRRVTLNILLDQVISQLGVDAADVLMLNSPLQTLLFAAGQGFHTDMNEIASVRVGESFAGRAVLERRLIHIEDRETASENQSFFAFWQNEGFSNYYAIPLITKGQVKGVLEVFRRSPFTPDPEWVNFLETLADQTAIAIDNAQLFENLQSANLELAQAYEATIEGWSRAMDLRDHETEGHTLRVTKTATDLAQSFGLSDQEILHIRRGALLHDVGKMGVPDHILLKPGKLVDMEWALMQQHPQFAYEMLQPIQYLRESLDIPYCHHEKWDGTGYPQGLKGEQIPLAARIFAIVDVYDALTSDRPYRSAWPKTKVLKYIRELSGLQFDPQVVDQFMEMFGEEKSKV